VPYGKSDYYCHEEIDENDEPRWHTRIVKKRNILNEIIWQEDGHVLPEHSHLSSHTEKEENEKPPIISCRALE